MNTTFDGDEMNGWLIKEMGEAIYFTMGLHPQAMMISPEDLAITQNVEIVNRVSLNNYLGEERGIEWLPSTR